LRGIAILGTATTAGEARLLVEAGVDAVVAQGAEASAHRGTFAIPFEAAMVSTLDLAQEIAAFAPAIASGGIMDGRDLATMLAHGAIAAQLGTAFPTCPESGGSPAYRQAILRAASDGASGGATAISRAFSVRPARGLPTHSLASSQATRARYYLIRCKTRLRGRCVRLRPRKVTRSSCPCGQGKESRARTRCPRRSWPRS